MQPFRLGQVGISYSGNPCTESFGSCFVVTPPARELRCLIPQARGQRVRALAWRTETDFLSLDRRKEIG
jgi:hypothetical protein